METTYHFQVAVSHEFFFWWVEFLSPFLWKNSQFPMPVTLRRSDRKPMCLYFHLALGHVLEHEFCTLGSPQRLRLLWVESIDILSICRIRTFVCSNLHWSPWAYSGKTWLEPTPSPPNQWSFESWGLLCKGISSVELGRTEWTHAVEVAFVICW